MADDKVGESASEKPFVENCSEGANVSSGRRSSSGGRGGSTGNYRQARRHPEQRQESREDNSSETSLSGATNSPAKSSKGTSPGGNKEKRASCPHRDPGRGRRGAPGQSKRGTPNPTPEPVDQEGGPSQGQEPSTPTNSRSKKNKQVVKKRAPPKEDYEIKPNDVFVNEKSHFVAQLSKCKRLFEKGNREIFLHGLGKAIPRAINIAFELKKFYHETVDYTVNTSTVQLCDDVFDPENPDQPPTVRTRNVSSVDIRVFRSLNIP